MPSLGTILDHHPATHALSALRSAHFGQPGHTGRDCVYCECLNSLINACPPVRRERRYYEADISYDGLVRLGSGRGMSPWSQMSRD